MPNLKADLSLDKKEDQIEHDYSQKTSDHAVFTFGRFNPITTGHQKLIQTVKNTAKRNNADHHIFASHTQDSKKNPLTHSQKVKFIRKMIPDTNIHDEANIKTAIHAIEHLHKKGYKKATMLVGSDRVQEFSNLLNKYNPGIKDLEVKSAGERDPDGEGVEGISASKMRQFAQDKNFKAFARNVPKKEFAKDMYDATRKGMKLEQNNAIFLVGPPGSGKDFVLRTVFAESNAKEVSLRTNFTADSPLILNGNAYDYDRIVVEAAKLVETGYDVAMVYVYTSDEDSKQRNEVRIRSGSKTITESVRSKLYKESIENMHIYNELFGKGFFLFDNSEDFRTLKEERKREVTNWLKELNSNILSFFKTNRDEMESINELFEKTYPTIVDMIGQQKKVKGRSEGNKYEGGIAVPGDKAKTSGESEVVEGIEKIPEKQVAGIKQFKGRPKKGSPSAPNYSDSRIGTVPSGGVGLSTNLGEGKTFGSFRKKV